MDPTITQYGPVVFLAYILIKDVLPKIAPEFTKIFTKRASNEDRLFHIIEQINDRDKELIETLVKLQVSIETLTTTMTGIDSRVARIEIVLNDVNSVASKLFTLEKR
jgi:hypothetical protein